MSRVALATFAFSMECGDEGRPVVQWSRLGAWLLALAAALILVAAVTVSVAVGPIGREHGSPGVAGARVPVAAWGPVSRTLGREDPIYRTTQVGSRLVAGNPRQHLSVQFSATGVNVRSGQLRLGLRLRGYGYGNTLPALAAGAPTASANRVLYGHGSLSEWYANGPLGLEQGFTLSARPTGRPGGPLTLAIGLSGNARATIPGSRVAAFSRGGVSLSYRGLVATDARGRTLRAWLQLRGRELLLRVRDAGAQYPLRIDPFVQQAELIASDAAPNAQLGYSVAFQGNTIVAGADNATVNGNAGQGAVYVFVKPNGGWQNATQTAKLTASDGAANDNLGGSVAIQGNTIVVGAAGATVNGNAGQGAVYVFVKPNGGWQNATQTAKLTASDGAATDGLGASPHAVAGFEVPDIAARGRRSPARAWEGHVAKSSAPAPRPLPTPPHAPSPRCRRLRHF